MKWNGRKGICVDALAPRFFTSGMSDQFAHGYLDSQLPCIPKGRTDDPCEVRLRSFPTQIPLRAT